MHRTVDLLVLRYETSGQSSVPEGAKETKIPTCTYDLRS